MKRLPITAALLLLFVGVWFGLGSRKQAPELDRNAPPQVEHTRQTAPVGKTPAPSIQQADQQSIFTGSAPPPNRTTVTPRGIPITAEYVRSLATGPETIAIALPDGRSVRGVIEQRHHSKEGAPVGVSGRIDDPGKGIFRFRVQPAGAASGPVVGAVVLDDSEIAFRVLPGSGQPPLLAAVPVDQVICRSYAPPPENIGEPEEIPADYPTDIPIPPYQNGIIPLQSRPGATGVVYLDFDGEEGPHEDWGDFDAQAPGGMTSAYIKNIWTRVAEDFAPFNLNVTTDLQVFLNAPETARQRCIITPTNTASPGAGGVAWVGSFGDSSDVSCWCFSFYNAKYTADIISHEIGHTLGLYHHGRISPPAEYYRGHGTDPVGWAPIMGVGYEQNLTQWSHGEYPSADKPSQDDIAIIAGNDNVGFIDDDAGETHALAANLEIFASGEVKSEGNIGSQSDVDAFRFSTTGGTVELAICPVPSSPNLDILAEIHDSTGAPILSINPFNSLTATLSANLPAGDYTVRVDGVGRGDGFGDDCGYTDYGSLGQYTITGTLSGAVEPDRFSIAENSPSGSVIGTVVPRKNHNGSVLEFVISSGNSNSAFAIDPATGTITVANPSALDFEALSSGWNDPAAFDLTVGISDSIAPALNESLRVVVTVTNVNEPLVITVPAPLVVVSHTVAGVQIGSITATDPDEFDFATLSVISGDPTGRFSISSAGLVTVTGDLDASVQSTYSLTVRATNHESPAVSVDQTVTITVLPAATNLTPGFVYRTIYDDVYGPNVADLVASNAFPTKPAREIQLSDFSDVRRDDSYGSTVRAWMIAPVTGNYRFWISGDNSAELFLSTDAIPASMVKICELNSPCAPYQWEASVPQASAAYQLTAGQVCYVEARHKEEFGNDHLSVAWEITDPSTSGTLVSRQIVPGRYLSPHFLNYSPTVSNNSVDIYRNSYAGYRVETGFVSDANPGDTHTWAIAAGNDAGAFTIDSNTGEVTVADADALQSHASPTVHLTLTATDNGVDPLADSGLLTIHLLDPSAIPTAGLTQEFWDDMTGSTLSSLYADSRYPDRPDRLLDLTSFNSSTYPDTNFGTRIRAYVVPPTTGLYTFHISSNNAGSLLLSTDESPSNAVEIASVANSTNYQSWEYDPSQTSTPVELAAGQRYFIEGRMKQGSGSSHLSVAWSGPNIPQITIIGDFDTQPYDSNVAPEFASTSYSFNLDPNYTPDAVVGVVTATDSPFEEIRYAIVSGDPLHAFKIHPTSGTITIANSENLVIGAIYNLQIGAQDSGHGRRFAPRETLVPVAVVLPNTPPQFAADPIPLGAFPACQAIALSLAPYVTDEEDPVVMALVSGPSWISIAPNGNLSGTPTYGDFGPWSLTVSANDGHGHLTQGIVTLTVAPPLDSPLSILAGSSAPISEILGTADTGSATHSDTSDNLYQTLAEAVSSDTSALECNWTFTTTPNRAANLRIEAHHSANVEDDDFQISISTDGGETFTNALLITNTADNDTQQTFSFTTGPGEATVIKIEDTNRTSGNVGIDTLSIDLLALELAPNTAPATNDSTFQVASHAPVGVGIGNVAATDPDAGQILTYSIPRGNEAGLFSITPAGDLKVAADIPPGSGPFSLIVVSTDNGSPSLANYATVTINVVSPIVAPITFLNLTPTYNGSPQSVIVSTSPSELTTAVTYDGSPTPPTTAGSYTVTATVIDPIYTGSDSATLTIEKAPATVTITGLSQPYDGTPKSVTIATSPPGLDHTLTYGVASSSPTDVGDYTVTATITDPNHMGTSVQTFAITNLLTVTSEQTFIVPETTIPYQSLQNDGTLIVSTHPLQITGDATNNGILRLYGDAILTISGTFTNSGVIDIINWNGTLPPELVNTGTILDRSALRILASETSTTQFTLSVPDFAGHLYQLETSSLADPWTPLGPPVPGTGDALNPPALQFTPDLDGPTRFYRVVVTPAP